MRCTLTASTCCAVPFSFTWCAVPFAFTWCAFPFAFTLCAFPFAFTWCAVPLSITWCTVPFAFNLCENFDVVRPFIDMLCVRCALRSIHTNKHTQRNVVKTSCFNVLRTLTLFARPFLQRLRLRLVLVGAIGSPIVVKRGGRTPFDTQTSANLAQISVGTICRYEEVRPAGFSRGS